MTRTTLVLAALLALALVPMTACSKSKGSGKGAAIGGSCHNPTSGLCFQYPTKDLNEAQQSRICQNDPGAKWSSGQPCPAAGVAQECQLKMGPFLKEDRMFVYKNNARAGDAVAYCDELGFVPVGAKAK